VTQPARAQYVELKANVHRKLLNRLNLEALANADRARAESEIRTLMGELLAEEGTPLSLGERDSLFGELMDEVFGSGRSSRFCAIPRLATSSSTRTSTCSSSAAVCSSGADHVQDDRHLLRVIDRIVAAWAVVWTTARRWLTPGSRTAPASRDHSAAGGRRPALSNPAFSGSTVESRTILVTVRALTKPMLDFLAHCVRARLNAIISGRHRRGQGDVAERVSGVHRRSVSASLRSRTPAELQLHQEHVARLERGLRTWKARSRAQRQLLVNALV